MKLDVPAGLFSSKKTLNYPVSLKSDVLAVGRPLVVNGVVYSCSYDHGFVAYDEKTLSELFSMQVEDPFDSYIDFDETGLYLQHDSGKISYFDAQSLVVKDDVIKVDRLLSGVVLCGNELFAITQKIDQQDVFYTAKLTRKEFRVEWEVPRRSPISWHVVDDDHLIVVDESNFVQCLDARTGNQKWEIDLAEQLSRDLGRAWFQPAVYQGVLIVFCQSRVVAVDVSVGNVLWDRASWRVNGIVADSGRLYVLNNDVRPIELTVIDVLSGNIEQKYPVAISDKTLETKFATNGASAYEIRDKHLWVVWGNDLLAVNFDNGDTDWSMKLKHPIEYNNILLEDNRLYIRGSSMDAFEPDVCCYVIEGDGGYVEEVVE